MNVRLVVIALGVVLGQVKMKVKHSHVPPIVPRPEVDHPVLSTGRDSHR